MLFLKKISRSRIPWFLLLVGVIGAIWYAYHLQTHYKDFLPCYYCVLDRYYLCWIGLAGLIGIIKPRNIVLRLLAIVVFLYGSITGLLSSIDHLNYLTDHNPLKQCGVVIHTFIPVQKWFPAIFTAYGNCDSGGPEYLSFNLVQLTTILFVVLALVAIVVALSQLIPLKNDNDNHNSFAINPTGRKKGIWR